MVESWEPATPKPVASVRPPEASIVIVGLSEKDVPDRSTDHVPPKVHTCAACSSAVSAGNRTVSVPDPRRGPMRPDSMNAKSPPFSERSKGSFVGTGPA